MAAATTSSTTTTTTTSLRKWRLVARRRLEYAEGGALGTRRGEFDDSEGRVRHASGMVPRVGVPVAGRGVWVPVVMTRWLGAGVAMARQVYVPVGVTRQVAA